MSDRVGRSRERIAQAKAKLRGGWGHALALSVKGECGAADGGGPLPPSAGYFAGARADLSMPAWLSRRRVLQGSALLAAAGLVAALPRERQPESPPRGAGTFATAKRYPIETEPAVPETAAARRTAPASSAANRKLALYNENTGESVTATFWAAGDYVLEELESIHWLLRDHHVDEMRAIDLKLVELLYGLKSRLEIDAPLHILSAYRTPKTNAKLRGIYDGVAVNSFHIKGQAVDLYVPGRRKNELLKAARALKAGGVGNYRSYVHLDTGPVRYW